MKLSKSNLIVALLTANLLNAFIGGGGAGPVAQSRRAVVPPVLMDLARHLESTTIQGYDNGAPRSYKTFRLTDANLQLLKDPNGWESGVGNLILGPVDSDPSSIPTNAQIDRMGMHSLIMGQDNQWTGSGHIVHGHGNYFSGTGSATIASQDSTVINGSAVLGALESFAEQQGTVIGGFRENAHTQWTAVINGQ